MWYQPVMNSSLEDDMLMDADMNDESRFRFMASQNPHQSWAGSTMDFKSANANADMSYHSFNWAPVEDEDHQYTPPPLGTSKETISSFDYGTGSEPMSNQGFMPYHDNEAFLDTSQYINPTYSSSQRRDDLKLPSHPPRPSRSSSNYKQESPTAMQTGLEVPKKPKLNRRSSDQSATSLQSNSNCNPSGGAPTSTPASNEAHIIAERRYRNNLNAKIAQIQNALQDARFRSHSSEAYRSRGGTYFNAEAGSHDIDAASPASSGGKDRRRKADILDEAAEYIRFADLELRHLSEEVQWLSQALAASQGRAYDPQQRHRG